MYKELEEYIEVETTHSVYCHQAGKLIVLSLKTCKYYKTESYIYEQRYVYVIHIINMKDFLV